ncbi:IPT/TIG domain-containing protein [Chitinimonas sp. PSY-7]|uniref:IPT/TIG domain-containing protein n=1 Tax=Chitinimonas sp. PSY-7 TaxID=3459088 RepID=UPI00404027CF
MSILMRVLAICLTLLLASCWSGSGTSSGTGTGTGLNVTITEVSPRTVRPGGTLTVTGTGFKKVTSARLGAVSTATPNIISDTSLTVIVPANAVTGKLEVSATDGTAGNVATTEYNIVVDLSPTISNVPSTVVPGQTITITGTFLDQIASAKLGTVDLPIVSQSATQLVLTVPTDATSGAPVLTTKSGTQVTSPLNVTVLTPLNVTDLSPTEGIAGSNITLTGAGLDRIAQVMFGSVEGTITSKQPTQLTVTVPVGATLGTAPLQLVAADSSLTTSKTYRVAARIVVNSFNPTFGLAGTVVTLSGSGFSEVSTLSLSGVVQTIDPARTDTSMSFTVQPGATSGTITLASNSQATVTVGSYAVSANQVATISRIDFMQTYSQKAGVQYQRLVPGKPAVVRAYVQGSNGMTDPGITLVVKNGSTVVASLPMTGGPGVLPTSEDPLQLGQTYNATLTAAQVVSGLNVTVSVPPSAGGISLDATPVMGTATSLKLTLVPVRTGSVTATAPTLTEARTEILRTLPLATTNVDIITRAPYTTSQVGGPLASGADWDNVLDDVKALRDSEGNGRQYYGFLPSSSKPYAGLAFVNSVGSNSHLAGIGLDTGYSGWAETFIHEIGHNFSRYHAPCGGAGNPDANYPYAGGALNGTPLYDINSVYAVNYSGTGAPGSIVNPAGLNDIMGYCSNSSWFSDYNYNATQTYLQSITFPLVINQAPETDLLVISGRVDMNGVRFATPTAQRGFARYDAGGAYVLRITLADGTVREQPVRSVPVEDGAPGLEHFSLAIPYSGPLAKLEMFKNGRLLNNQSVSTAAMQTKVVDSAPSVSWREQDGMLLVSWNAAAFPSLTVTQVGSERRVLAMNLSGGSAKIPLTGIPAGGQYEFALAHALDARLLYGKR